MTNGSFSGFALSHSCCFLGNCTWFCLLVLHVVPSPADARMGSLVIVGWGMIIGGVTLFVSNPLSIVTHLELFNRLDYNGHALPRHYRRDRAFILFMSSMKYISPVETSILSSFEPLTAMVISVIWFGQVLGMWQLTGAIVMLVGVTWLSVAGSRVKVEE